MRFKDIHPWDLSPRQAINVQHKLKQKIKLKRWSVKPKLIAGADVAFKRGSAVGAVVVLDYPKLKIIEQVRKSAKITYPYIPGLLTFREGPVLEKCLRVLKNEPDVIIFDGQGIAHPRNMGIATHIGILLDKPTIGCAKTHLFGEYKEPTKSRGSFSYLFDPVRSPRLRRGNRLWRFTSNGVDRKQKKIGAVLRTRDNVKPVYVSPGYKIDFESSLETVLLCTKKYRLPEPLRLAHQLTQRGI